MSKLTHDPRTTFAVFDAGGVGGYFGAVLARAETDRRCAHHRGYDFGRAAAAYTADACRS